MTPRPRGGWQFGNRPAPTERLGAIGDELDCFGVERQGDGVWLVKHFRRESDREPACVFTVTRQLGETDVEALARSHQDCEVSQ